MAILLFPSVAAAECYTALEAPSGADCIVLKHNEQRGVWFSLKRAEKMREMKLREPELKKQIDLYAGVTRTLESSAFEYKSAYLAQVEATRQLQIVNKGLVREKQQARAAERKAIAQRNAWYRSPFLWFGGGVGAAVLAGFVAVYATK